MSLPKLGVLGTKVARRVLLTFMVGAAAPVAVMAVLSFTAISRELRQQSEQRLTQFTSIATQSILERLSAFSSTVESAGRLIGGNEPGQPIVGRVVLPPGIESLAIEQGARVQPIAGSMGALPSVSPENEARLARGQPIMVVRPAAGGAGERVFMAAPIDAGDSGRTRVWARVVADSIWAPIVAQAAAPTIDDLCVLDATSVPLFCLSGRDSPLPGSVAPQGRRISNSGQAKLDTGASSHLVAWREVYLRPSFGLPSWTLVVGQATSSVYGAGDQFVYNLLLTILILLSAALLVTHVLVRKTMEPLDELSAGTRRIAQHDLSTRVEVDSDDEFGDLAASFNAMAERIGLQFRRLEAGRAIDHAALTASDHAEAAKALLEGVGGVVPSGPRQLLLTEPDLPEAVTWFMIDELGAMTWSVQALDGLPPLERLCPEEHLLVRPNDRLSDEQRAWLGDHHDVPLLVVPVRTSRTMLGVITVSGDSRRPFGEAEAHRVRDLAEQAAVALEKLRLDKELASMSWEALRALANAIDAKSAWTTGHSERVTELSLLMARTLDLDAEEMDVVHRGGLLHDIGKIGVPAEILDFDGILDAEMRAVMERHPEAGARILEPIRAFKPIIPIVLYHHERWNGSGYPEGLTRTDIPALARLVAVADVFDAMVSARPYRPALDPDAVLAHIRAGSGIDFDPVMVQALEEVMRSGWRPQSPSATAPEALMRRRAQKQMREESDRWSG